MPLSIPTRAGISGALKSYVRADLPDVDPSTERRSFIGGLVKSLASLLADFYIALKRYADHEPFPQTATGKFLTRGWWADITKLQPLPAAPAHGYVVVTGTSGTVIPRASTFTGSNVTYTSLASSIVLEQPLAIAIAPDAINGVAIATAGSEHHLASGMTAVISGASPSGYNGEFTITVTDARTFTYEPDVLPGSAATGDPLVTATYARVEVEATTLGQETNLDEGAELSLSSAPSGASSTAIASWGGLSGGTDVETEDSFRERVLEALGTDYGMFSADEIEIVAKMVPGVTRVMIRQATLFGTNGVNEGQVKIAFLRDNDSDPLPSAQEVADVKTKIVGLIMPAHTAEDDVIVLSPPPLTVDVTFTSITPDTAGMRLAIKASLDQFFREDVVWGEAITLDSIKCAILSAYDTETRQRLRSFALTDPSGDITPSGDEYPVLGDVTFGS